MPQSPSVKAPVYANRGKPSALEMSPTGIAVLSISLLSLAISFPFILDLWRHHKRHCPQCRLLEGDGDVLLVEVHLAVDKVEKLLTMLKSVTSAIASS